MGKQDGFRGSFCIWPDSFAPILLGTLSDDGILRTKCTWKLLPDIPLEGGGLFFCVGFNLLGEGTACWRF